MRDLSRSNCGRAKRLLSVRDCLAGGLRGLVESASNLRMDLYRVPGGVAVGEGLDVVTDRLLSTAEVFGLCHADTVNMKLPSALPALGTHGVGAH